MRFRLTLVLFLLAAAVCVSVIPRPDLPDSELERSRHSRKSCSSGTSPHPADFSRRQSRSNFACPAEPLLRMLRHRRGAPTRSHAETAPSPLLPGFPRTFLTEVCSSIRLNSSLCPWSRRRLPSRGHSNGRFPGTPNSALSPGNLERNSVPAEPVIQSRPGRTPAFGHS